MAPAREDRAWPSRSASRNSSSSTSRRPVSTTIQADILDLIADLNNKPRADDLPDHPRPRRRCRDLRRRGGDGGRHGGRDRPRRGNHHGTPDPYTRACSPRAGSRGGGMSAAGPIRRSRGLLKPFLVRWRTRKLTAVDGVDLHIRRRPDAGADRRERIGEDPPSGDASSGSSSRPAARSCRRHDSIRRLKSARAGGLDGIQMVFQDPAPR